MCNQRDFFSTVFILLACPISSGSEWGGGKKLGKSIMTLPVLGSYLFGVHIPPSVTLCECS